MLENFLSCFFLLGRSRKNGGHILRADVLALSISLGRVMDMHEYGKQGLVGDNLGVEGYLYDFDVSGGASFYLLVAGVCFLAAAVTGDYGAYAF